MVDGQDVEGDGTGRRGVGASVVHHTLNTATGTFDIDFFGSFFEHNFESQVNT